MRFFGTIMTVVVLTTSPILTGALSAQGQNAPAAAPPPAAQPTPATNQATPDPSPPPPAPAERLQPAPPANLGQRQKVEGVVQSVSGSTMELKSDTGRMIVVDLSRVSARVHEIAAKGDNVTVIGIVAPGSDRLVAQALIGNLKPNRGDPVAGPRPR